MTARNWQRSKRELLTRELKTTLEPRTVVTARKAIHCITCDMLIHPGQTKRWTDDGPASGWIHDLCPTPRQAARQRLAARRATRQQEITAR